MTRHVKLRAAPAYLNLADARIDRESLTIRDTVAMLANVEALGHGFQTDQRTLEKMLELSGQYSRGIKMRFGHPGMSENAMGQHIAMAKNFYIRDGKLLHDIHFIPQASISPSFANDPIEYLFQMAEQRPEDIGESVVIECETVWTLPGGAEIDGDIARPDSALTELPVIRPTKFYFVDVVGEPALTRDGLLASMFSGSSALYTEKAFDLIDEFRSEYDIPLAQLEAKVDQVLARYLHSRGHRPGDSMNSKTRKRKFDTDETVDEGVVSDVIAEAAPESDDTQPTPVEAAPEEDALDSALATAQDTEAALADEAGDEPEAEAGEPETVPAAQYAEAMNRVQKLEQQVAQLVELATINARNNASLTQRVVALEGEPVVTDTVGGARSFEVPRLPSNFKKPTHVSQRAKQSGRAAASTNDPALLSLMASQARQVTSTD